MTRLNTRAIAAAGLFAMMLLVGCTREAEPPREDRAQPEAAGTIVAVGDSLTAGYGVDESLAYPARLADKLQSEGYNYRVINSGISGETSSGARSRIDWILTMEPDIVILETGANDGLRGIDPELTKENITRIVASLKAENVTVLLAGMKMFHNLGDRYTREFADIYPAVARDQAVRLIPFFLEGVAGKRRLNQSDGIHPTSEGYRIIVETIYPHVIEAIRNREG